MLGAPIESSVEFCRCEGVAAVEDLDLVGLVDDPVEVGPGGGEGALASKVLAREESCLEVLRFHVETEGD